MPTHNEFENYGGIIDALNTVSVFNGNAAFGYSKNFDGIIQAILDLGRLGDAGTGEYPPGWEVIKDDQGNIIGGDWQQPPSNGDLWFDTRQGRLMVYVDDNYYQANGADVLTVVSPNQPDSEVTGALWYNPTTGSLFIYDGTIWLQIAGTGTFATETLYLSNDTKVLANAQNPTIFNAYTQPTNNDYNQASLNRWLIQSLAALDADISARKVIDFGNHEPSISEAGDLWFDQEANILKTYTGNDWIPVIDQTPILDAISDLSANRIADNVSNTTRFQTIEDSIAALPFNDYATKSYVAVNYNSVNNLLTNLSNTVGDITRFKTKAEADAEIGGLTTRLTSLEGSAITDATPLVTQTQLTDALANLTATIEGYSYATEAHVASAIAAINLPDVTTKVEQTSFDAYKLLVDSTFIKKAGGEIQGPLKINNMDVAEASLNFSDSAFAGEKILRMKTRGSSSDVTFGNTDKNWEIAWQFDSDEDFAWKHATEGKVFAVNKDGAICAGLKIADFGTNDANGLVVSNVVDVKSTLSGHTTQITDLETTTSALTTQVNGLTATKNIYYSDTAPTGTVEDGDIWFDSQNLRLNVRHNNFWMLPDRVEDVALKSALYNAINSSTDYTSLKAGLLAALS